MTEKRYKEEVENILSSLASLPVHTDKQVKVAAEQLKGMNADLSLGRIVIDPLNMDEKEAEKKAAEIINMTFEELERNRNLEEPFTGGDKEEWAMIARLSRLHILQKQYTLLCNLRDDDPEAWDEVNELYYDD